jgi:hypothetical protein
VFIQLVHDLVSDGSNDLGQGGWTVTTTLNISARVRPAELEKIKLRESNRVRNNAKHFVKILDVDMFEQVVANCLLKRRR